MENESLEATMGLVAAARGGDDAALDRLFERYLPWVRRTVALKLGRPLGECTDMEDVVQESLLEAFRALKAGDHPSEGKFRHWLTRLVENNVRDAARRRGALKRGGGKVRRMADFADSVLSESLFPGAEASPSQVAIGREAEERLERAMLALDPKHREAIVLRKLCGMSYAEMADALGYTKEVTVRSLFSRAWSEFEERMGIARPAD